MNAKDAPGFGILKSDDHGNITSFIEKPNADLLPDWTSEVSEKSKSEGKEYLASMVSEYIKHSVINMMVTGRISVQSILSSMRISI